MHRSSMVMDIQQATLDHQFDVVAPIKSSSKGFGAHAIAALATTTNSEAVVDLVMDKRKEKVEEKKNEPVFI